MGILDIDKEITITREHFEKLIKAEATLEILGRLIAETEPYEIKTYRAVAGQYIPAPEKKEDEK